MGRKTTQLERLEGRRLLSTISGTFFIDQDGAGTSGGPLSGAIVYADLNVNGQLDAGEPSTSSSGSGSYSLTVPGGTYVVRGRPPAGYHLSYPADQIQWVSVGTGMSVFGVNFGAFTSGSYGVNFFRDFDNDGIKSVIEGSITGRTVWVDLDQDGVLDDIEPAGATGNSGFAKVAVRPGSHLIRFSKPPEWSYTSADGGAVQATVTANMVNAPPDAGSNGPGIVQGMVFNDINGNGRYDDVDTPRAGSLVYYDADNNNTVSGADVVVMTPADGKFRFVGPFIDSRFIRAVDAGAAFNVSSTTSGDGNLFMAGANANAFVSGFIYADLDGGGTRNGSEPYLPGRPVYVDLNDNGVPDSGDPMSRTANNGHFRLDAPVGMRRVRTLASDDYVFGANGGAFPLVNVVANGNLYSVGELGMLDNRPTRPRNGIQGFAFEDTNRNGRRDAGERGLPGRTVYADADFDGVLDAGERSAVSDSGGLFVITELVGNRSYDLRQIVPAGHESIWVGNTGVNRATFGSSAALALMDIGSRSLPAVTVSAAFTGDDGFYPQNVRLQFSHDVSKSLGKGDVVLYSVSDNSPITPLLWDFEQSVVNGATVATVHFPGIVNGHYRLTLRAGSVCDAALGALAADFNYEFVTLRGSNSGGDTYRVKVGANASSADVFIGNAAAPSFTVALSPALGGLFIDGRGGDDTLIVDAAVAGAITFNGGAGNDQLTITGSGESVETVEFSSSGASASGGAVVSAGADVERRGFDGNGGWDVLSIGSGPAVTLSDAQHLQSLTVAAGASAALSPLSGAVMVVRELSIAGKLDVQDGAVLVDYEGESPLGSWVLDHYDGITGLLASGRNGGLWNGNGINTSLSAAGPGARALGVDEAATVLGLDPAETMQWRGVTVDATAVIVKYTYAGDIDLDGDVDGDDYFWIDSNVAQSGIVFGYGVGDIELDGDIDGDDYFWLDSNIAAQGPPL